MVLMSFFPKVIASFTKVFFRVMDPLVDAYSGLTLSDKGRIDPAVREKSLVETRKFLIEVGLSAILMLVVSRIQLI
jgi:hypothetical protein